MREVRAAISIPLAVKVGPFYSAFAHMAAQLTDAGADGLVLFNRFLQPDIDLETLEVAPWLALSTPSELRLPLRWIAILRGRVAGEPRRNERRPRLAGRAQAAPRRRGRRHGRLGSTRARPGRRRRSMLDGLREWMIDREYALGRAAQGQPQPGGVSRPGGVRARQLHARARLVRPGSSGRRPPHSLESDRSCRASSRRHPGACPAAGRTWRFQFVIWMGFYVAYQVARGAADRSVADAFHNGEWVLTQGA